MILVCFGAVYWTSGGRLVEERGADHRAPLGSGAGSDQGSGARMAAECLLGRLLHSRCAKEGGSPAPTSCRRKLLVDCFHCRWPTMPTSYHALARGAARGHWTSVVVVSSEPALLVRKQRLERTMCRTPKCVALVVQEPPVVVAAAVAAAPTRKLGDAEMANVKTLNGLSEPRQGPLSRLALAMRSRHG